ncbi:ethionine resistance protein [Kickxella alabastrina]|uniref:Ethionine resistance protein n=1 Tax=Kickxella alabastrina TaxID=61397 RepID=A0ACC1IK90_9FUNG|nr:ethionine resistance protein [Kickxella alabastrina]
MSSNIIVECPRESVPLLNSHPSDATLTNIPIHNETEDIPFDDELNVSRVSLIKQEAWWLFISSIPLSMSYFLQSSFNFISMLSVGRLGVNELAAASLGLMMINFIVLMPGIGLASALESFCNSAFTASSDKTRVGFHARRGLFAVTLQLIPTAVLFLFMDQLLLLLGQTPEVSELCGQFLRVWLVGSWPLLAYECLKRFVQAQGIMKASTWVMVLVAPVHIYASYALVWSPSTGVGFIGAPLAMAMSNWLLFLGITGYIVFSKARHAWGTFSLDCIDGIGEYYRLAIPSAAMMACSWAAFELVTFGSSIFGPVSLAAQACMFTAMSLTYQTPAAIGSATATRIGNALGQGKHRRARYAAYVSISTGYIVGIVCSTILFTHRRTWGYIFSKDEDVVALCAKLMPLFAAVQTYDGMNGLVGGIMRALGRQSLGAALAFPSFWIMGIPLGFYLGMGPPKLEVVGLWLGLVLGVIAYSVSQQCFILFYVDWRHEVKACLSRVMVSPQPKKLDTADSMISSSAASMVSYGSMV